MIGFFTQNWRDLALSGVLLGAAIVAALVAHFIIFWLLQRFAWHKGKAAVLNQSLARHARGPTRWIFPLLAVLTLLPGLPLPSILMAALEHITGLDLIAAIAWPVVLFVDVASDIITGRYRIDVEDNLMARRIQTQFQMLRRIVFALVAVVTLSIMLMTFPAIKLGMSLVASAGRICQSTPLSYVG